MLANIIDPDALKSISPASLSAFARSLGWRRSDSYGEHSDIYVGDGLPEILIPRSDRLGDYASVTSRLIGIFARVLERDEIAVYRDLIGADRDVIRVRSYGAEDDGSVNIDAGVKLVMQAREMLLAAACAVKSPQAIYRAGANKEANDYIGRVKLGQTEHGSFVITLLAPVPPQLQPQLDPSWASIDEEPMERLVTRKLMTALRASRAAAEKALSGQGDAFDQAISDGVSANLCEAVASLIEQSGELDISVTWARTRPTPETHRKISFSYSDAEILKEAARTFRRKQPRPDVTLYGTVNKLKREHEEIEGVVSLKAIIDDRLQSVSAILDQENYKTAIRAHDDQDQVLVTGDLERVKQRWQLTNAQLRILQKEIDEDDVAEQDNSVQ
jgi:hypothetical protein